MRVTAFAWLRLVIGAASAAGGYSYSPKHQLTGGAKSYRRTETTGRVHEHPYNVIYELSVGSPGGQADVWWIDRRRDVTARVVLPEEHRLVVPLTPEQIAGARQLAARMYAAANDLPDAWLEDSGAWPEAIKNATRPSELAAHFASLTSRTGRYVALPRGKDGRKQALRIRGRPGRGSRPARSSGWAARPRTPTR